MSGRDGEPVLLTITTTHTPATDLGYLLHKHPGRCQTFDLAFGAAHVFYPEAREDRCTVALVLDVDPVGLVRRGREPSLEAYVNDRPYVASSFLSVAIAKVFGTALSGRCPQRPDVAAAAIPLRATLSVLPCDGGEEVLHRLFVPLGYELVATPIRLDPHMPEWGDSRYFAVTLDATVRLSDLLSHLYVLVPVLDGTKHYWIGDEEVEKLLRHGEGWLGSHPDRELITRRYLRRSRELARAALARLVSEEDPEPEEDADEADVRVSLHDQRIAAVVAALREARASRVIDLGCGEGKLLRALVGDASFTEIVGVDVSSRALEIARRRLRLDRLAPAVADRVRLVQGALTYRDRRLAGFDAAAVVEVIEHLDADRLPAFERALFEFARPRTVVVTTPNIEHNVRYETMAPGTLRHADHRFEWTRSQFAEWTTGVAERLSYAVRVLPVGGEDPEVGPPTQMAVFTLADSAPEADAP